MFYSFSVRGSTKDDVLTKVAAELDKVVASQPIHSADRQQAQASVEAFLEILPDVVDGKDFNVSVSGSVGWTGTTDEDRVITGAGVNVSASLVQAAQG
jgi:hypothetical protein